MSLSKDTKIGNKRTGTMTYWYRGTLKVIDLENNVVEDHDVSKHGERSSRMELIDRGKNK